MVSQQLMSLGTEMVTVSGVTAAAKRETLVAPHSDLSCEFAQDFNSTPCPSLTPKARLAVLLLRPRGGLTWAIHVGVPPKGRAQHVPG